MEFDFGLLKFVFYIVSLALLLIINYSSNSEITSILSFCMGCKTAFDIGNMIVLMPYEEDEK